MEYEPALCGINIAFPGPLKDNLQVDVALLRPTEPRTGVEHLEVSNSRWPVGTQVLMAGFPDEMEAPLRWTDAIDRHHEGFKDTPEETEKKVESVNQLLMIKSGMIGYSDSLMLDPEGSNERTFDVGFYYVDNAMHSGSSGGPVVNLLGQALGIITKRAVTRVSYPDLANPNKEVPSGAALAVAAYTLIDAINNWSTVDG